MDVRDVKLYVYENDKVELVLQELGMHHIKWHDNKGYVTCGMPDGDNPNSTTIYNNSNLNVVAYTRDIVDSYGVSDIISLICFIRKIYFSAAIRWLCDLVGLEYYDTPRKKDKFLQVLNGMLSITKKGIEEDEPPLKPLKEEEILPSYERYTFLQFEEDHISPQTQYEFELGLNPTLDYFGFPRWRITIPIRDELGTLVGVKGRIYKNLFYNGKNIDHIREEEGEPKYLYIYPCAKSQILYGLYKTMPYIQKENEVIISESEKGVMQLWSYGYRIGVGIGGHELSNTQREKIIRLGVSVTVAFDKDVTQEEVFSECKKLSQLCKSVYYIYDKDNILDEKESPMDDPEKWGKLYKENKYKYYD